MRDARAGKGRFDLIPNEALTALALRYERGAEIYGETNWMKGIPIRRCLDSAMRHLVAVSSGDTSEDHAAAVLWNVATIMATLAMVERGELPKELDDRKPILPTFTSFVHPVIPFTTHS